jgi:hypothetical protein
MRIKEVTLKKNFKIGLPNYSNQDIGVYMTWEVGEHEEFDFSKGWDIINQQLTIQANDLDPSWIKVDEHKDKYKATVNIPKQQTLIRK